MLFNFKNKRKSDNKIKTEYGVKRERCNKLCIKPTVSKNTIKRLLL